MLNLHVYEPHEIGPRDWDELRKLGFSTDDVECIIYVTKLSEDGGGVTWSGKWPINPTWKVVRRGHWAVYYHA